jgi:hypothetical protein
VDALSSEHFIAGLRAEYHFDGQWSRSAFRPLSIWFVMRCPSASIFLTIRFFTAHHEL